MGNNMNNLTICAVRYEEFTWLKTRECCEASGMLVVYVDRNPKGCGSLSEAINRGIKNVNTPYVFIATNITFDSQTIKALYDAIKDTDYAAICPVYESDHKHLRPASYQYGNELVKVPFIEFTTGIFSTSVLKLHPLDEDMPYVGMDLDWSKRVKDAGFELGSLKSAAIGHDYIRHLSRSQITAKRLAMRKKADSSTIVKLKAKWGNDWRNVLGYHNGIASK